MESMDKELLMKAIESNKQIRRLYDEHCRLDDRVAEFERRKFLTELEQDELKRLKRKKLAGMDEMMSLARSGA